ncbi:MAG: serine/threonine protein kinase, partial [Myxococcales bacterium]|nr:serine/threonine protein kinase [Myxococcales bacterium]
MTHPKPPSPRDPAVPADVGLDETVAPPTPVPGAVRPTAPGVRPAHAETAPLGAQDSLSGFDVALAPGAEAGEYVIEARIGEGAFGDVYRASHPLIGKVVAVKVLKMRYSVDPEIVSRFVAEARAVNTIQHPHIVDIFAFGALPDGRQYYVMELLEGRALRDELAARGALGLAEAVQILAPIAEALDAAHAHGIAHRDLKPDNIFLRGDAQRGWRPKLLDFGVAKLLHDDDVAHGTATGAPVGTPAYMAPEQCLGRDVDTRADLYAFGVVAYEVLGGALPFTGTSAFELMSQHIHAQAPRLDTLNPALPDAAVRLIDALLAKDPGDRPAPLTAVADHLRAAAAGAGDPVREVLSSGQLTVPRPAFAEPKPRGWPTPAVAFAVAAV